LKVLSQTEKENSKSAILTFDESQVPLEVILIFFLNCQNFEIFFFEN